MRPKRILFMLATVAAGAALALWFAVQPRGTPAPIPPAHAGDDPPAEEPASVYLPLIASHAQLLTFSLPADLPLVETLYPLTDTARLRLQQHGFVILDTVGEERLSQAYERLGSEPDLPLFVTSDAMLYLFHTVLDDLLLTVEQQALYTDTLSLVQALQADSAALYAAAPPTRPLTQEAARHNLVVLSVARSLLEPDFAPPAEVAAEVLTYTHKISEHTAVERYPGDDYTQYEPRGHYAGDARLERYFRAMKWLGRRIYRIQDEQAPHDADVELVAAAQLARMLEEDAGARAAWQRLDDVTRLLCGPADSITPPLVSTALSRTLGVSATLALLEDPDNLALLRDELLTDPRYPTSEIIPVPTLPGQMPPKYVQIMGERYLPDAEVMQETTFPHTGRTLPSGLEVMAALLASDRADALLAEAKAQDPAFAAQLADLRAQFGGYPERWWTRSTYNAWLYSLRPLLDFRNQPGFGNLSRSMQGEAWERKELNTALASWSHLRHDFILYGKQTTVPFAAGGGDGFVEPVPEFYTRLGDACAQISDTLASYALLPEAHAWALTELKGRLDAFADDAAQIVAGEPLSQAEQDDIHDFGLWLDVFFSGRGVAEKPPITVADVASDAGAGRVLHEGVGLFNPIVVIYEEPDGTARAGLGFVLSYYEFTRPDWERLTDAEWQTQVLSGTLPARPGWMEDVLDSFLIYPGP